MNHLPLLLLSAMIGVLGVHSAAVGEKCSANSECSAKFSNCDIVSPSCGHGTCKCIPGHDLDPKDQNCKRAVKIGHKCGTDDLCTSADSSCINGVCTCNQGFKQGKKDDCVSILKTEIHKSKCYDSVQCYYNMVCLDNACTCYTGYKVEGDYNCVEREVGDSCGTDDDCSRTPNTYCSGGVCACSPGYKRVRYMTSRRAKYHACIPQAERQVGEGGRCNTTVAATGTQLCAMPFVCTGCDSSTQKCARVGPRFPAANQANQQQQSGGIALLLTSAYLLFLSL